MEGCRRPENLRIPYLMVGSDLGRASLRHMRIQLSDRFFSVHLFRSLPC